MPKISSKYIIAGAVALVLTALFFGYSFLRFQDAPQVFSWPDETATSSFIQNFVSNNSLRISQPYNYIAADLIHPRSTNIAGHDIVPTGFIGMPLIYGLIAKVISTGFIPFITPLLALAALYFFFSSLELFFDRRTAIIGALLLALQPAWWYYANFSLLPNIPFLSLLIIGFALLLPILKTKHSTQELSFGMFFISLALMIRPNELWWVILLLLSLLAFTWKKIAIRQIVIMSLIPVILGAIYLAMNKITYGSFFALGYQALNGENSALASSLWQKIFHLFFPFGIHPITAAKMFIRYILPVDAPIIILALLGIVISWKQSGWRRHSIILAITAAYLSIYYLSMPTEDLFMLSVSKLGISYHRYLLPLVVMAVPLAAFALNWISKKLWPARQTILTVISLSAISVFAFYTVFFMGGDNLVSIRHSIEQYHELHDLVTSMTPDNSIIITERADKWLFPDRAVIQESNFLASQSGILDSLAQQGPLYLITFADQTNMPLVDEKLGKLKRQNGVDLKYGYMLYEIK